MKYCVNDLKYKWRFNTILFEKYLIHLQIIGFKLNTKLQFLHRKKNLMKSVVVQFHFNSNSVLVHF